MSRNEILSWIKGHNSATNMQKMTCNNSKLDLANINAYIKFVEILSICSPDIEQKLYFDVNQGPQLWRKCVKNSVQQSQARSCNMNAYTLTQYENFTLYFFE